MITKSMATAMMHLIDNHKACCILTVITEDDRLMMRLESFVAKPDKTKRVSTKRPEYQFFIHKGNGEARHG